MISANHTNKAGEGDREYRGDIRILNKLIKEGHTKKVGFH